MKELLTLLLLAMLFASCAPTYNYTNFRGRVKPAYNRRDGRQRVLKTGWIFTNGKASRRFYMTR